MRDSSPRTDSNESAHAKFLACSARIPQLGAEAENQGLLGDEALGLRRGHLRAIVLAWAPLAACGSRAWM